MSKSISILILAAGASTRMDGEIKQLLPWGNKTLLENAITQAKAITKNVYMVLGANAEKILDSVTIDAELVQNNGWKSGMGSSISCGLSYILKKESPQALLIMVVDQPLVDSDFLLELIQKFDKGGLKITATEYQNRAGVPAIFDNSLFSELLELHEDFGARKIIEKYKDFTNLVASNGKEIDIDTKKKYIQLSDIHNFKYD
ncbi:nucleotidyltransferase family protein [Flagellimonas onchidii]|uniref:nucleotidyltransferase family protein n=1 Tax=Flagellimonas onchidii TaxID=2562684 RepID=UPI0010A68F0C|nr:nucleotidyltransferase family protein [Allomuricauda onchidii]